LRSDGQRSPQWLVVEDSKTHGPMLIALLDDEGIHAERSIA
jgi:hypothetical protein